ncbi:YbaB/EbfC family nucleoid-associated protein [Microvenator marinus]|jgi:DNA-binding YbaB/EbfC family protein|uniref:Nucleoid-associated protein FRD01_11180 n=1 Tax=Microvenator marinus TaxID=2600177 RepID=A0A5B8XZC1_9DELT|nr:YbaB/EbfC family nucleoid-associated protein [Microvenator marinus]
MTNIVRQAQRMQGQIQKVQEEIGEKRVEASAGGGVVTAVVNGNSELVEVKIQPEALEDVEMLQEMIVIAVNQATKLATDMMNTEVEKITGGLNIPGLF